MNLNDILNYNARKNPNKIAVVETRGDKKISYKNLVFLIERYAFFLLKNEVVCGSRVSIKLKNSVEWIALFYAVLKIGAIPVLIDFQSTSFEISQFIEISNSDVIVIEENDKVLKDKTFIEKDILKNILIIPSAPNSENLLKNDKITYFEETNNSYKSLFSSFREYSKIILFTYRGFGFPLSVEYEEKNLILSVLSNISASLINGESIVAHLLPSTHIFGLSCNILSTLTSGGEILVVNNFTPKEMLIKMDLYNANFITAVPTIIKLFIETAKKTGSNLKNCKRGIVGGNSFSKDLFEEWQDLTC
nr:class I adenylate-forming enzyme family protein [Spirochaetota bacterium]